MLIANNLGMHHGATPGAKHVHQIHVFRVRIQIGYANRVGVCFIKSPAALCFCEPSAFETLSSAVSFISLAVVAFLLLLEWVFVYPQIFFRSLLQLSLVCAGLLRFDFLPCWHCFVLYILIIDPWRIIHDMYCLLMLMLCWWLSYFRVCALFLCFFLSIILRAQPKLRSVPKTCSNSIQE